MARPNLLLCFDAFGTLFKPKRFVAQQYAEVARQCGLGGFTDHDLQASLRAAMKRESQTNPNYGKATGLGATRWWTNVIHNTFTPLVPNQALPPELAPRLLHRFATNASYDAETNLVSTLRALRQENARRRFDRIVVGVITNSDDRVPSILSSFGLRVSPMRYGSHLDPSELVGKTHDVDFHCMSYDVGVEKPDSLIFNAAELMLAQILAIRDGKSPAEAKEDIETWRKVYVGDDYGKDVIGSGNAGWNPVLLASRPVDIPKLEHHAKTLDDVFRENTVVRVDSIGDLAAWLTGKGESNNTGAL